MASAKKVMILIITCSIILLSVGSILYYRKSNDSLNKTVNDNEVIELTINKYFNEYFKSLDTLNKPDFKGVLENNIDNKLYIAANETKVEQYKAINLSYKNISFNLDFSKLNIEETKALVEVTMGCKFNYSSTLDAESGISGVRYAFNLKKDKGKWIVIKMDADLDDFKFFKEMVDEKSKQNSSNREKNIYEVKDELIKSAKETAKYRGGKKE